MVSHIITTTTTIIQSSKASVRWDEELSGFGVRFNLDGSSVYVSKVWLQGRAKWATICDTRRMPTDRARNLVSKMKMIARAGVDPTPLIEMELALHSQLGNNAVTFGQFAHEYIENYAKHQRPRTGSLEKKRIDNYLLPLWSDRRLDEIGEDDVQRVYCNLGKSRPRVANRLVKQLVSMFRQAVFMGHLQSDHRNPAIGLRPFRESTTNRPSQFRIRRIASNTTGGTSIQVTTQS